MNFTRYQDMVTTVLYFLQVKRANGQCSTCKSSNSRQMLPGLKGRLLILETDKILIKLCNSLV